MTAYTTSCARDLDGTSVQHCTLSLPQVIADIRPDESMLADYVTRSPCTTVVQIGPEMSEHEVNTERQAYVSQGLLHTEGGWPKDVDASEAEHVIRWRRKVEKDEEYIKTIVKLGVQVEELVRQNNAIDIYEEYFKGAAADHSSEAPTAKTLTVFRDPCTSGPAGTRQANYISWYPDAGRKIAVAYSIMAFQGVPEGTSMPSYIWDVSNPTFPELELSPSSQLCCAVYNPRDPNIIAGGQYNGQVAWWDARKGSAAMDASPIERSHRDPVYDVTWLQSKTATECASCSTDGNIHWWDTRRLGEPVESLLLQEKGSNIVLGAVSEYGVRGRGGSFQVHGWNRTGYHPFLQQESQEPAGKQYSIAQRTYALAHNIFCMHLTGWTFQDRIGASYTGHHAPVLSLQRHPTFPKYFLSAGDWTARVWMEDLRAAVMTTRYSSSYVTAGAWSPTRPGVFFTTKADGTLDVWDYFYKQNDPALTLQVRQRSQLCLDHTGKFMAAGARDGSTTLLNLCDGLAVLQAGEKQSISQMFERETKRERNLEARAKEMKAKAKKDQARAEAAGADASDEVIKQLTAEFMELTKQEDAEEPVDKLQHEAPEAITDGQ
eukprot:jgi/Chlat1/55/ChrspC238811S00930